MGNNKNNSSWYSNRNYDSSEVYRMNTDRLGESYWDDDRFDRPRETTSTEENKEKTEAAQTSTDSVQKPEENKAETNTPTTTEEMQIIMPLQGESVDANEQTTKPKLPRKRMRHAISPLLPWHEKWMLDEKQYQ